MTGKSTSCTVRNGTIRITCLRCGKKQFVSVQPGVRRKSVRCVCGLVMPFTLNHRSGSRESTCSKAQIMVGENVGLPVYLVDTSAGGVGFNIPHQHLRTFGCGQKIRIKYKTLTGATVQRYLRIRSMVSTRVGAEFI